MRDVTETVFIMELVTVWLVSVADEKEDPRVNGRVDVPVGSEENVTLVPAGIEVRVTVFIAELPTVWLVSVRADIDALDINVSCIHICTSHGRCCIRLRRERRSTCRLNR